MTEAGLTFFRRCSTCREPIAFEADYFRCSVSTCNRKRTPLYFCSVACWDAHQADARHRDAGAEPVRAPSREAWERELASERRKLEEKGAHAAPTLAQVKGRNAKEVLVVAQRFKDYVRDRAGMNTSERALFALSDELRKLADEAILAAGKDGRKTVMDRDLVPLTERGVESLATGTMDVDDRPDEVLVVVSKFKEYVRERAGMSTSDAVAKVLSAHLRRVARRAIRRAAADDRKTLLDRDFV